MRRLSMSALGLRWAQAISAACMTPLTWGPPIAARAPLRCSPRTRDSRRASPHPLPFPRLRLSRRPVGHFQANNVHARGNHRSVGDSRPPAPAPPLDATCSAHRARMSRRSRRARVQPRRIRRRTGEPGARVFARSKPGRRVVRPIAGFRADPLTMRYNRRRYSARLRPGLRDPPRAFSEVSAPLIFLNLK